MSDLTNILSNKIIDNTESIGGLRENILEVQKNIDFFTPVCQSIDSEIFSLVNSIVSLENEIVVLHASANAVGCGTITGLTTMYPDSVTIQSYNLSLSTYSGDDPYDVNSEPLSSSNVGFGTFVVYVANDSSKTGIGSLFGDIGNCYNPPCGDCASFSASIAAKENQVTTLRNQLTSLVTNVNGIKRERVDYEIERYGYNYVIEDLGQESIRVGAAITSIQFYET